MIEVYQTKFGGSNYPIEEQGNCMQAALASILEIPLESSFNTNKYLDGKWYERLNEWLSDFGLVMLGFDVTDGKQALLPKEIGYHLIEAKSTTLSNGDNHALVGYNGEVIHDPNPYAKGVGEFEIFWVFSALDPAKLRKPLPIFGYTYNCEVQIRT